MKNFFFLLLIPFSSFCQNADLEKGIHFEHGSFAELLAKARKENKMIMADAYTTWCGPCKWMVKNIFPDDSVAAFYNKNFINAKIDMEKGEGVGLAKKYDVACYPTYLFIDENGKLIHRASGGMEAKPFVELGIAALSPEKQFASMKKKYDTGTMTADEMAAYILMKGRTCLSSKEEMAKYFPAQSDAELLQERNWNIMRENFMNLNVESREFQYLIKNRSEFEKKYPAGEVEMVINESYSSALFNYIKEGDNEGFKKTKDEIKKLNFTNGEELILSADMEMYKSQKDWNGYGKTAIEYIDKFGKEDAGLLNNTAWSFYENISDKTLLAKAEEWAKHAAELHPDYASMDTYTAVLFKLGKKSEAQGAAEKAIELAKANGDDYASTAEMLEKIKAMK